MKASEFSRRREELMEMMGKRGIAIIPTAPVHTRNRDVEHVFRPDSDFYYLTGFEEPEAVAVIRPGASAEYVLFCRERDPERELWDGYRAGQEGAQEKYGADDSFPIEDLDDILPGMMEGSERVYYSLGCYPEFDHNVIEWVNKLRGQARKGVSAPIEVIALDHLLHDMRLFKSREEIRMMKRAADISVEAHKRAMRVCQPGMYEYQIEAELQYEFMRQGARSPAYPSIVGGGENACVLHYIENRDVLKDGDLLLIDAGAEYEYYAADITRTFPVSGRFSEPQKQLYQAVLDAQAAAIAAVRPGNHWNAPHEAAVESLTASLLQLGLIEGELETLIEEEAYKPYFMHRTGHWLGMDVHDVGDYKVDDQWRVLEPGMVLTVEPGLYIAKNAEEVDAKWRGIGIRIEDDVLVTRDGHDVLTAAVPKSVEDVEAIMAQRA